MRQRKHDRGPRDWYQRQVWRTRAQHQLQVEPLCRMCGAPGEIVDHVEPHRGDYTAFRLAPVQTLCRSCHSGRKAVIERRGYDDTIGPDGYPVDPRHPARTRR